MPDDKPDDLPEPALTVFLPAQLEIHGSAGNPEAFILHLIRRGSAGGFPVASYAASWPVLESQEKMDAWVERTLELFAKECQGVMLNAAGLLLRAEAARAMMENKLAPFTPRGIVRDFLSVMEKFMREQLGVEQGRPALWTHVDLSNAILEAMRALPAKYRNYEKVAERLRKDHPGRGPKSGASLKKMVANLDVDWMGTKASLKK